jgi:hypothetical protein
MQQLACLDGSSHKLDYSAWMQAVVARSRGWRALLWWCCMHLFRDEQRANQGCCGGAARVMVAMRWL